MPTLKFTGFAHGATFDMSASQGGQTVGPMPISIDTGSGGGGGEAPTQGPGAIVINIDRTTLQCAPDSVRFDVDLVGAGFDTPAPTVGQIYDARLHDLIFLWDFGDSGTWSAPVNVLDEWKTRTTAKGPWVSHVYANPGTYTASVWVIEPASGKTAYAETDITVADPDAVFAATRTICLNPAGDGDFAGTPPGALRLNSDTLLSGAAPWTTQVNGSSPVRWLFKRGASYTVGVDIAAAQGMGMAFGAYGSGTRPVLNGAGAATPAGASNSIFYLSGNHGGHLGAASPDIRFANLIFQGNHDPVTQNQSVDHGPLDWHAVKFHKYVDAVFSNCRMAGFAESTISDYANDDSRQMNIHLDNCILTDFGGQYPIIMQDEFHPLSSFSMTGTRHAQNPDAMDDGAVRAPLRLNHIPKTHIRGCDVFHTDRTQPCLKLAETPEADGMVVNVHSCALEGGIWPLSFGSNASQGLGRTSVHNIIADGLVILGNYGTQYLVRTQLTGVTLRNTLMIQPAVPVGVSAPRNPAFVQYGEVGTFDAAIVGAAPIRVYNCTLRSDRDTTLNNGDMVMVSDTFGPNLTGWSQSNNVLHAPGLPGIGAALAPLSETTLWTPRGKGRRDPGTGALDASLAPPADAVKDTRPMIGSPALGAALSGDVSYMDIQMQDRPEPPSQGAWEA